jgi:predicted Zn-dependent peptidase
MQFKKTILPNGVRVITAPMKDNPTVTVMIDVATGSFYENPEDSGISHFLEHMCFKGTQKRPNSHAITYELDSIGAQYNAFTSKEVTGYWAKADFRHFDKIADVCADIFKNSIFPEKEIEKEKGVVMGEIDMYADDPQERLGDALMKHMYKGEPAERDVLGTKQTVGSITREKLIAYRASQYTGPNIVVAVAGGVSEDVMLDWARENFSDIPAELPAAEFLTRDRGQAAPETLIVEKDTDQAHIVLAWRSFDRSNPDRFTARLIKNILRGGMSSRLFSKLRDEMGSGYYVGANHLAYKSFGAFIISTGTKHERVPEIVEAILGEAHRLKNELVTEAELRKVKEYMRAHRLMSLETSDDVCDYGAEQETIEGNIRMPEDYEKIYAAITAEDVMRVAKLVFDNNKLTVAAIGRGIDKDKIEKLLGLSN